MKIKEVIPILILITITLGVLYLGFSRSQEQKKDLYLQQSSYVNNYSTMRTPEDNKVYVEGSYNSYYVYIKGTGDNYIGYNFERNIRELDKSTRSSNYDTWNINTAGEFTFLDNLLKFKELDKVVTTGEWEMAFREVGASDFSGGILHGDEVLESFEVTIDGEDYTNKNYIGNATNFEAEVISIIYRDNTITENPEPIATHTKKYIFNVDGLIISQSVIFDEEVDIDVAYLGMLPISKDYSDVAVINNENHNISVLNNNVERTPSEEVLIQNEAETVELKMSVLESNSPQSVQMMIVNNEHYNKVYSIFVDAPYYTYPGEEWTQTTQYSIITKN